MAFPEWEVSYRSCWPNPFGGAWISDVDLIPLDGDEDMIYHFDSLSVDVPIVQYYRSGFASKKAFDLSVIKEISLEFTGGEGPVTWPFTFELGHIGNASASPFEAAGCAEDGAWAADEFPAMGLSPGPTSLTLAWSNDDGRLTETQAIETPGVGRAEYRGEITWIEGRDFDDLNIHKTEWHIKDEGFVAARNRFCAQKDGITPAQFVERHVAVAQRWLQLDGLEARESSLAAYRKFAESGGTLDLVINYSPAIDSAVAEDEDWGRWVSRAHGELVVNEQSQRFGLRAVEERPFPEGSEDKTVFAILQDEQARRAQAARPEQETQVPAVATTVSGSTNVAADVLMTSESEVVQRPDTILEYRALAAEVGQRFKLYAKGKSPMRVEVVGIQDGLVKVRRYVRSGWLEHTIARAGFERAERIR